MTRRFLYVILFLLLNLASHAQGHVIDSLRRELAATENDTIKMVLTNTIAEAYAEINPDTSLYFAGNALVLTRKLNFKLEEVYSHGEIGYALINLGNFPRSLQTFLTAIAIAEDPKSEQNILSEKFSDNDEFSDRSISPHFQRLSRLGRIHQYIGILYGNANNHEKELDYYKLARQTVEPTGNKRLLSIVNGTMGRVYLSLKKPDSALITAQLAYDQALQAGYKRYFGSILLNFGRIQLAMGNKELAIDYFRRAIASSAEQNYLRGVISGNLFLAEIFRQPGNDSCLYFANAGLKVAQVLNAPGLLLRAYTILASYYYSVNLSDSTVKYQAKIIKINDSLFNSKQVQQFQNIDFDDRQRKEEILAATKAYQNKVKMYSLVGGMVVFLLVAILLWRSNQHRQKSNALLREQKMEIESALSVLKATQAQLIQAEKMASLGELTAGIAHEIENPLNFINNFSELNKEMLGEISEEVNKGNYGAIPPIVTDLTHNMEKINQHGQRADAIVRSMLQHSSSGKGNLEQTDLNALVDEYLRISFHGMKAREKNFSATLHTDYDKSIEKVNVIPQNIGRALLNLYNNAYDAVSEKRKKDSTNYHPMVKVSTKKTEMGIEIQVRDNGKGIPEKLKEKIFQPFFTTKPTGRGTGLGLSMSYDIIKAHGGELIVESVEGEGTVFIIRLPEAANSRV